MLGTQHPSYVMAWASGAQNLSSCMLSRQLTIAMGVLLLSWPWLHDKTCMKPAAMMISVQLNCQGCCVSEQELEGRRVPRMASGKTLPCFAPFDPGARSGGFIGDRFLTGLRPQVQPLKCPKSNTCYV